MSIISRAAIAGAVTVSCAFGSSVSWAEDKPVSVKPFGRTSFTWTDGSSSDDDIKFDEFSFDSVELGANFDFKNKMRLRVHSSIRDDDVVFKDVYLQIPVGDVKVRIGNTRVPNFFNWHVSGASKNFVERPTHRRAFGGARQFGVHVSSRGEDWGWMGGVFKGDINEKIGSSDWTLAARGFKVLKSGETDWWLGASVRYRGNSPDAFSYGDRPYTPAVGKLAKYKGGTSDTLLAGELAFTHGAFYGAAEGALLRAKSAIEQGKSDGLFSGYVELGYNLSGEAAKFDFRRGAFAKTKVDAPVFSGGWGLWQLAARYDVMDLRAGDEGLGTLNGGLQKTIAVGFNWQPNTHIRILSNYSSAKVSHTFGSDERINAVGMRFFLIY